MATEALPLRPSLCPCLGSWRDPATAYSYPTRQNGCYADPEHPRDISKDHQQHFCLADYKACPYFPADRLEG